MEKIFFIDNPTQISSLDIVKRILADHFGVLNASICRTEKGKPYLDGIEAPLFFSITHTKKLLFVVFSDTNVGADAELLSREVNYQAILRRFPIKEKEEICSTQSFLCRWTIKESAIKWLGGTIAHDLEKLSYKDETLFYQDEAIPARITARLFEGHVLSICCEKDFSYAPFIHYTI